MQTMFKTKLLTLSNNTLATSAERKAKITGSVLVVLAILVVFVFKVDPQDLATFKLTTRRDALQIDPLVVPGAFNMVAAAILAFLGIRQFMRGGLRWTTVSLALGLILVVISFLVWATIGKSFNLTSMLQATVLAAVPIALGGLAGILSERVAVINIAIEGMLLAGAFTGALVGSLLGGWLGLLAAIAIGGLFGLLLAALVVTFRMDQIIAGVVINLFVLGVTSYVSSQVFSEYRHLNSATIFRAWEIPVLSDIPILGPVFFNQNLFVYVAFILVALSSYYLFSTKRGLQARAVGENPKAADTLGINVYKTRYIHVTLAGMIAGFGGAFFTLGAVGRFEEDMTSGRGFIGLAAMIFGRWHPVGALLAALIFGFADSLQQKLALLNTPIPFEFLAMAPYIATIIVVAGLIGKARPPASIGKPYIKE